MGNRQLSGIITITVYTRGVAPRHWVCGITEQPASSFSSSSTSQLTLLSPLGPGSEADVLISQLAISPMAMQYGWDGVRLSGVFDGVHRFRATLHTQRRVSDDGYASIGNTWNATYRGQDGQLHVLSIEFKVRLADSLQHAHVMIVCSHHYSVPDSPLVHCLCVMPCVYSLVSW